MTPCTALRDTNEKLGAGLSQQRLGFVFLGRAAFARPMTHRVVLLAKRALLLRPSASPRLSELFSSSISLRIGDQIGSARNTLNVCVSIIRSVKRKSLPFAKLKPNTTALAGSSSDPRIIMMRKQPTESQSANKCLLTRQQDFLPIKCAKLHPSGAHAIEYFT